MFVFYGVWVDSAHILQRHQYVIWNRKMPRSHPAIETFRLYIFLSFGHLDEPVFTCSISFEGGKLGCIPTNKRVWSGLQ